MSQGAKATIRPRQRGTTMVEFCLVAILLFTVVFATIEFYRMLLVYTAVANAASAGTRYAIVHGSSRSGSGVDGASGPGSYTQVQTVVRNYAAASPLDTGRLTINVTYPDSSNNPGNRVRVAVIYPYDPFTWAALPLSVNLSSQSQGVIEF